MFTINKAMFGKNRQLIHCYLVCLEKNPVGIIKWRIENRVRNSSKWQLIGVQKEIRDI